MLIRRRGSEVRVRAPAKLNLFLEVLRRRPDGYHDLATLMVAVDLYDVLTFAEGPPGVVVLASDHPTLTTGPDNLILKAADLLKRRTGCEAGATIGLKKRIPLAAGLAGGSSDAAAALAGLNRLWRLGLSNDELAGLGSELGSDVPFFFATPAAWCTGRGEIVEPLRLGRRLDFVLACPDVGLSTAQVFQASPVPEAPLDGGPVRRAAEGGDVEELGRLLHNRLQPAAERLCPAVAGLYGRLTGLGPAGRLMSGSGSTVYALCRGPEEALRVARTLRSAREERSGLRVQIVQSCD